MLFIHFQNDMLYLEQISKAYNKEQKFVVRSRSVLEFTYSIFIDFKTILYKFISHFNLSFIMEILSYAHTLKKGNYLISSSPMSIACENACLINILLKNPTKLNYLH
jgi:hypothetical protein